MKQNALDFTGPFEWDAQSMAIAPSPHPQARETSALAANENLSRRASQTARLLSIIKNAGDEGISDIELQRATGFSRATICARRGWDLRTVLTVAGRYTDPNTKRSYTRWKVKS